MKVISLCAVVMGLFAIHRNVSCNKLDGCLEGASQFNSKFCVAITAPGSWFETTSTCPFSPKIALNDLHDDKSDNPDFKDFEEFLLMKDVKEVWWLEKDALLYGERIHQISKFPSWGQLRSPDVKAIPYPYTVTSRWKWQNTSSGACMSYNLPGKTVTTRSCWSDDEDLRIPAVCWSLRGQSGTTRHSYCPDGFTTELGFSSNCSKLVTANDIGHKPTWDEARSVCSSLGPEVYLLENVHQNFSATTLSHECNGEYLPLKNILGYAQLNLIQVFLFQPKYTSTMPEVVLMNENSTFNCIMCQTERSESQTLSLRHNLLRTSYVTLTVSNYDIRENQTIMCYTDASSNTFSDSSSNQFQFVIQEVKSGKDKPVVHLLKSAYHDVFFLKLNEGKKTLWNEQIQSVIESNMVTLFDTSTHRLKTLQISLKFNSSGNYWCTGINKKTLVPMFTEKVFLDLSNDGSYVRYSVLVETTQFIQDLSTANMEAVVSSTLAQVLHVTDGIIELKRISNNDMHLLFHVTVPPDKAPLAVDATVVLTGGIKIVSIVDTDTCGSVNVTDVEGGLLELQPRRRGDTNVDKKCVDVSSLYNCVGDGIEGAFWKLKEGDIPRPNLGLNCTTMTQSIDININSTEEDFISSTETTLTEDQTNVIVDITSPKEESASTENVTEKSLIDYINKTATQQGNVIESASSAAARIIRQLADHPLHSNLLTEVANLIDTAILSSNAATLESLDNLEKILTNMILDPQTTEVHVCTSTVAILVGDLKNDNPMIGIDFVNFECDLSIVNSINYVNKNISIFSGITKDVSATLTQSSLQDNTRLAFVVILSTTPFATQQTNVEVISPILNVILSKNEIATKQLPNKDFIEIKFKPNRRIQSGREIKKCVFWDTEEKEWSEKGCILHHELDKGMDVCQCNHLTHFAEIITYTHPEISPVHQLTLEIISVVGCSLSLAGLLTIMLTAIFREWRKELGNLILLNLCAALTLNLVAYLLVNAGLGGSDGAGCIAIGVLLHYSVLSCFCWMLLMAGLQVLRLLTMLGTSRIDRLLLKASIFGWGVPIPFVVTTLAIDFNLYTATTNTGFARGFCYPTGTTYYLTVAAPVGLIVFINLVLYTVISCRICNCFGWGALNSSLQRHGLTRGLVLVRQLRTLTFLFFLLGIVWTIAFLAHFLLLAYLFCLVATLQGFVVFLFFFVVQDNAREHWTNLLANACGVTFLRRRASVEDPTDDTQTA